MAWHHLECWSTHGGCSACGYTRDRGPGVQPAHRAVGEPDVPRLTSRARPGQCASPGCRTRIPLVSVPQLCAAHRPPSLPSAEGQGSLLQALLIVTVSPLLVLIAPLILLIWLLTALQPNPQRPPSAVPPSRDTPSPDYA